MRSRPTARRAVPSDPVRTVESAAGRGRAAPRSAAAGRRRTRRTGAEPAVEPAGLLAEPALGRTLPPEELYRQEKSRRGAPLDPALMAEARQALEDAMMVGGKKRGASVTIGGGRRRKPALRADEFDLPEYRPGSGGAKGEGAEDE